MSAASISPCKANATETETLIIDYYLDGDTMIVASATTLGKLYIVTAKDCSCPAGMAELPCKHASYRLQVLSIRNKLQPQTNPDYKITLDSSDELL
jgi:hypothetical protein